MEEIFEKGYVTVYKPLKGIGFIRRKKGKDVFFFYEDIIDSQNEFTEGDWVKFKVEQMPKGPRARKIEPLFEVVS